MAAPRRQPLRARAFTAGSMAMARNSDTSRRMSSVRSRSSSHQTTNSPATPSRNRPIARGSQGGIARGSRAGGAPVGDVGLPSAGSSRSVMAGRLRRRGLPRHSRGWPRYPGGEPPGRDGGCSLVLVLGVAVAGNLARTCGGHGQGIRRRRAAAVLVVVAVRVDGCGPAGSTAACRPKRRGHVVDRRRLGIRFSVGCALIRGPWDSVACLGTDSVGCLLIIRLIIQTIRLYPVWSRLDRRAIQREQA